MSEKVVQDNASEEVRRYDVWHKGEQYYLGTDSRAWRKMNLYQISDVEEIISLRSEHSAITRSDCGFLVLNDPNLMSVDVDCDIRALVHKDFADHQFALQMTSVRDIVQKWMADRPHWNVRIYRTAGGLRLLVDPSTGGRIRCLQHCGRCRRSVCQAMPRTKYISLTVDAEADPVWSAKYAYDLAGRRR